MKKSTWLVVGASVCVLGLLVMRPSQAQPAASAPTAGRSGACDVLKVFANYQKAKDMEQKLLDARRSLKAEDEKRSKQLDSMALELKDLNPSSKEYETRMAEMTRLGIERETRLKYEQNREMQDRFRVSEDIYKEVLRTVSQVAKDKGLAMVLGSDDFSADQKTDIFHQIERKKVLYCDSSLDVTDEVLSRLNSAYRTAGNASGK